MTQIKTKLDEAAELTELEKEHILSAVLKLDGEEKNLKIVVAELLSAKKSIDDFGKLVKELEAENESGTPIMPKDAKRLNKAMEEIRDLTELIKKLLKQASKEGELKQYLEAVSNQLIGYKKTSMKLIMECGVRHNLSPEKLLK